MKRIYVDTGNGLAIPVEAASDGNGNVVPAPFSATTNKRPILASKVRQNGHKCLSLAEVNGGALGTILDTESSGNQFGGQVRVESPGVRGGAQLPAAVHQIAITNTTGAAVTAVIGDSLGLVANYKNIDSLPAGVTIAGTWGTGTLNFINKIAASASLDYHGVHVQASNTGYFSGGNVSTAIASFDNSGVREQPLNFQMMTSDMSQNLTVRRDKGFRFGLFPNTAILVTVPAGETVDITFGLSGVGNAQLVQKYAQVK